MKMKKKIAESMSRLSLKTAKAVSSSASLFGFHQPKEPESLKARK